MSIVECTNIELIGELAKYKRIYSLNNAQIAQLASKYRLDKPGIPYSETYVSKFMQRRINSITLEESLKKTVEHLKAVSEKSNGRFSFNSREFTS